MKRVWVLVLVCILLLGCSAEAQKPAQELQAALRSGARCAFTARIHADIGGDIYTFTLDCRSDEDGKLSFRVAEPQRIADVAGYISAKEGKLVYDDIVLGFPLLAQGELSPVVSPRIFLDALENGYFTSFSQDDNGICVNISHVFSSCELTVSVYLSEGVPTYCEIYDQGSRILYLEIEDFRFL